MPWVMSHISWVQTLVNASGKKSNSVFFWPRLLLSFTSSRPDACFDLRVKSGALVPTDNGIGLVVDFEFWISGFSDTKALYGRCRAVSNYDSPRHFPLGVARLLPTNCPR